MKIFLICPVRQRGDQSDDDFKQEQEKIRKYVENLEKDGHDVYWPARDTNQDDPTGLRICKKNRKKIKWADKVHIWWVKPLSPLSKPSEGSFFDFGMTFMAGKKIVLANPQDITPTPKKSFTNVLLLLSNNHRN